MSFWEAELEDPKFEDSLGHVITVTEKERKKKRQYVFKALKLEILIKIID